MYENIRPPPKAGERKNNRTKKKMKSTISNDTLKKDNVILQEEACDELKRKERIEGYWKNRN